MHVTKIKRLYQLAFMPTIFPVNCYLFEEIDGLILIDTGLEFCCEPIIKLATSIRKPIKCIALTHPHSDHVGALDKIKQQIPTAVVYASKRDSQLMCGDFSLKGEEKDLPIKGGFVKGLKIYPERLLEDNDMLGSLRVISMSGHTPGSIYDKKDKILIAGDALQVKGGLAVAGDKRFLFPFLALATWNKE